MHINLFASKIFSSLVMSLCVHLKQPKKKIRYEYLKLPRPECNLASALVYRSNNLCFFRIVNTIIRLRNYTCWLGLYWFYIICNCCITCTCGTRRSFIFQPFVFTKPWEFPPLSYGHMEHTVHAMTFKTNKCPNGGRKSAYRIGIDTVRCLSRSVGVRAGII